MFAGRTRSAISFETRPRVGTTRGLVWRPEDGNNEDIEPPAGSVVPRLGFGKVWRQELHFQPGYSLGFPSLPERYDTATVQQFELGTAFHFRDSGATYLLCDAFCYITRGGEQAGRLWFRWSS